MTNRGAGCIPRRGRAKNTSALPPTANLRSNKNGPKATGRSGELDGTSVDTVAHYLQFRCGMCLSSAKSRSPLAAPAQRVSVPGKPTRLRIFMGFGADRSANARVGVIEMTESWVSALRPTRLVERCAMATAAPIAQLRRVPAP